MYQPRNLLTNEVTVSGKVRHIYYPNDKCALLDVITGTSPAERVKIVLYPTTMELYRSLRIEIGDAVEVQGNIQSSYHHKNGTSSQSVIANSIKRLYFSPTNEGNIYKNRFEIYGNLESIELKDERYGFTRFLIFTNRDNRQSHFLVSVLPEAYAERMPLIGEVHRMIGEIITIKATDVNGETTYTQEYLVHTII